MFSDRIWYNDLVRENIGWEPTVILISHERFYMSNYSEEQLKRKINQRSNCIMNKKSNAKSKHVPSISTQKQIVLATNEVSLYLYNYYVSISIALILCDCMRDNKKTKELLSHIN